MLLHRSQQVGRFAEKAGEKKVIKHFCGKERLQLLPFRVHKVCQFEVIVLHHICCQVVPGEIFNMNQNVLTNAFATYMSSINVIWQMNPPSWVCLCFCFCFISLFCACGSWCKIYHKCSCHTKQMKRSWFVSVGQMNHPTWCLFKFVLCLCLYLYVCLCFCLCICICLTYSRVDLCL